MVKEICRRYKDGETTRQIAQNVSLGPQGIYHVLVENGLIKVSTSQERRDRIIGEAAGNLRVLECVNFEDMDQAARLVSPASKGKPCLLTECIQCKRKRFMSKNSFYNLRNRIRNRGNPFGGCYWCEPAGTKDMRGDKKDSWLVIDWRAVDKTDWKPSPKNFVPVKNEWLVKCMECGEVERWVDFYGWDMLGKTCGCIRNATEIYGAKTLEWYRNVKFRANRDNLPFDLEPEDLMPDKIPDFCPVLGIPLEVTEAGSVGRGMAKDNAPTLDKFIPELGYVKTNVHIISWRANKLKGDGTPEEWLKVAEWCQKEDVKRRMRGSVS